MRPTRALGIAATVLIWLTAAALVPLVVTASRFIPLGSEAIARQTVDQDFDTAGVAFAIAVGVVVLAALAAGIVFWVWCWQARVNAETIAGPNSQDLSRGWTFWCWFCPLVNLWFPCQIVADIYRASVPREPRKAGIVIAWWLTVLGAGVVPELVGAVVGKPTTVATELHDLTVTIIVSAVLLVASAVLMSVIINRISRWQQR
jgi:Domain of unknown function (DUF4328)